jgi:hypothetical protein
MSYDNILIDAIDRDIRTTQASFVHLSKKHGVSIKFVRRRAQLMEPGTYPARTGGRAVQIGTESKILAVALHLDGLTYEQIAKRIGCHFTTIQKIVREHRETIEAAREPEGQALPPILKAKPICHVERWVNEGFDEKLARFMASNRLRLLRVSEVV